MEHRRAPGGAVVAVAQLPTAAAAIDVNVERTAKAIGEAGRQGQDLIVFPECNLSGYAFSSATDTRAAAIPVGDQRTALLLAACEEAGVHAVVGLLEQDGEHVYNTALLLGPGGILGRYRKQHLPCLGADRFVSPGEDRSPRVIDTPVGRIGLMICFDLRFPESARVLALQGADIIAMPTAWPRGTTILADHVTRVRALENLVYLAVADRGDEENGTAFLGGSQIVAPTGEVLVRADRGEGVFAADVDVARARKKRLVMVDGEYELDIFGQRKPAQYEEIVRLP